MITLRLLVAGSHHIQLFTTAMSNPNGLLLGQKSCHYLNQGRTFNGILMRAVH